MTFDSPLPFQPQHVHAKCFHSLHEYAPSQHIHIHHWMIEDTPESPPVIQTLDMMIDAYVIDQMLENLSCQAGETSSFILSAQIDKRDLCLHAIDTSKNTSLSAFCHPIPCHKQHLAFQIHDIYTFGHFQNCEKICLNPLNHLLEILQCTCRNKILPYNSHFDCQNAILSFDIIEWLVHAFLTSAIKPSPNPPGTLAATIENQHIHIRFNNNPAQTPQTILKNPEGS